MFSLEILDRYVYGMGNNKNENCLLINNFYVRDVHADNTVLFFMSSEWGISCKRMRKTI